MRSVGDVWKRLRGSEFGPGLQVVRSTLACVRGKASHGVEVVHKTAQYNSGYLSQRWDFSKKMEARCRGALFCSEEWKTKSKIPYYLYIYG